MIDMRKLKELVKLMVNNDLSEMDLRDTDEQVTIRRQGETIITQAPVAIAPAQVAPATPEVPVTAAAQEQPQEEGVEIVSPMVGTFYTSPDPNSPDFVNVDDVVSDDTTVCIVEAMKIFNEIKAQCNGSIIKVLVSSGDPVEFGQPLFLVKPQ
jgi:acetyl-CoA carboxylase biotin carboxyl carrier protein